MTVRLRRRVDGATFATWRASMPGLVLPPGVDVPVPPSPGIAVASPVPPPVAAALAVHADPVATVLLAVDASPAGPGPLLGCVSLSHPRRSPGLTSSLVRGSGWVEISLVGHAATVEEVLRWLPARPGGADGSGMAAGTGTGCAAPVFGVQVFGPGDAAPRWVWHHGSGEVPGREGAGVLAGDLRAVLAGCLSAADRQA